MQHLKTTHPVVRAAFGITALVLIAFLANWLISLTSFGTKGADFTEDKVHTLSKGTKSILSKLDAPVTIRYYASRKNEALPRETKLFIRRIDDILKEYVNLSNGKMRVENLDPQPDTDAEDSANLDGIQTQNINQYENVSLGLAISCLDQTTRLNIDPFDTQSLDEQETMFEYNLSRAVGEVTAVKKPVIGVMSALNLKPSPAMMPGQQGNPGWVMMQQLGQTYEIRDLEIAATEIPDDVNVLLLVHPAGISADTEFAIDQFILRGGTLIACLDAYSFEAAASAGGNPMFGGGGGTPVASTLPTLLPAWNINFENTQTLADAKYRTILQGNRPGYAILSLPKESMPDKSDVITKNLNDLFFVLPGAITNQGNNGLASSSLVKSSTQAGLVDAMEASQFSSNIAISNRRAYDLVTRLTGRFKTAFPDGKPGEKKEEESKPAEGEKKPEGEEKKSDQAKPEESKWLKEGKADSSVFIIADTDAFSNQGAYRIQNMGGMQAAMPYNGNSVLLLNIIDQAASSADLIGARSRASIRRPFTLIREMEAAAESTTQDKQQELQAKLKAAQDRLAKIAADRNNSRDVRLAPELEAEEKKFREEVTETNRQIRDLYKDLKRDKDALSARIIALNLMGMPGIILLSGLAVAFSRRRSSRAR
ncbi:MAG: hypothetical protein RLZZ553_304 [Verrucomicrobiota bacterium]|jgi:ABC-type uncharacterized transport system involved in gliding motility auxiliary subunit